jgi:CBS domain-containing protein
MPHVSDVVTAKGQVIDPEASLQRAAQLMDQLNIGSLPVCEHGRLLGVVTDRDITVRGTAAGLVPAEARVAEVMTHELQWCTGDQDCTQVLALMAEAQVRRLPVINLERALVGIVSLGDLATWRPSSQPGPLAWPQFNAARAWSRSRRTSRWWRFTPSNWRSTTSRASGGKTCCKACR